MKKTTINGLLLILFTVTFFACKSSISAVERKQLAEKIENAAEMSDFNFKATYAYPTGYRSIYLSPNYYVKVSPDTLKVHLPYYGRAYTASINPNEGGYNFTSIDFEYQFIPGNKPGNWMVNILINDLNRRVEFNFDISENGSGRLSVNDVNRQEISFQGEIITDEK